MALATIFVRTTFASSFSAFAILRLVVMAFAFSTFAERRLVATAVVVVVVIETGTLSVVLGISAVVGTAVTPLEIIAIQFGFVIAFEERFAFLCLVFSSVFLPRFTLVTVRTRLEVVLVIA